MKRIYNLLVLICIGLFSTTCKKETHSSPPNPDPLVEKAKAYFVAATQDLPMSDNPRALAPKTVLWDRATVVNLSMGRAVVVPVKYDKDLFIRTTQGGANNFHLSNLTHLLVYQSKGAFHVESVTGFPDTNYLQHPRSVFSGLVYVEDWAGNALARYLYEGGTVRKYAPPTSSSAQALNSSSVRASNVVSIEVCYQITGYNYSIAAPDDGFAWAEAPVCRPSMVPVDDMPVAVDYGNVGGAGSGGNSSTNLAIYTGKNPISNIIDYVKCFTFNMSSDHTYTVTVCIDQPKPGTREPWSFSGSGVAGSVWDASNPVDVGHTFLIFKETYGTSTIVRNIGFYPSGEVKPVEGYFSSQAQLADDEEHAYNISGTFTVNSNQFQNILAYVELGNNKGFAYDLNNNNCTTFVINALKLGNIYLPSTIGTWVNGQGNNPGDFGEDFRMNNIPGLNLSTSNVAHPNIGNCVLSSTPTPL